MELIISLPRRSVEEVTTVLGEALEAHVEGLKEAYGVAVVDGTIDDPQDLVNVTRDMTNDREVAEEILEVLNVRASG